MLVIVDYTAKQHHESFLLETNSARRQQCLRIRFSFIMNFIMNLNL